MKPAAFDYAAPKTIDGALALLNEDGVEARALAGGQSLVPLLNMRFARPSLLVDLGRVDGLDRVEERNGGLWIGAMVRQRALETDPRVQERLPLLVDAVGHIAHLAIRTRGTVGGSIAHADPAAELPTVAAALDARIVVRSADGGHRVVPVADFFVGPFMTAVAHGELLEAIELDTPPPATGSAFLEAARVHGAFALAGVAALVTLDKGRRIERARLALCGVAATPYTAGWLDEMLVGERLDDHARAAVAKRVRDEVEPSDDGHGSSEYRRHLAGVLTRRALALAEERARVREAA